MLKFLLQFLPAIRIEWIAPGLKPWLDKLPTVFAVLDAVLRTMTSTDEDWTESELRRTIETVVRVLADHELSAAELNEVVQLVCRRYDPIKGLAAKVPFHKEDQDAVNRVLDLASDLIGRTL